MKVPPSPTPPPTPPPSPAPGRAAGSSLKPIAVHNPAAARQILVVDTDPRFAELVATQCAEGGRLADVRTAATIDAAELEMRRKPAEILFVNLQLGDNAGIGLIKSIKTRWPRTQIVAVSRIRKSELCLEAWRAGASDMLIAPPGPRDIQVALEHLARCRGEMDKLAERNERLRIVCRRLNKARREIGQQVDLLCNDLVRAYQDMAQQLNVSQMSSEYLDAVKGELEVEGILRRTMEWVLRKLGPVNAAVYLPAGDEFLSLGAYLNLDTQADAPLIEVMGKTIVEQARRSGSGAATVALDDQVLHDLFGDEAQPLQGRSWQAVGCNTPRDCMAVLVVFRKQEDGAAADASTRALMEAMAPVLAERISQALGFYHRLHPYTDDTDDGQGV